MKSPNPSRSPREVRNCRHCEHSRICILPDGRAELRCWFKPPTYVAFQTPQGPSIVPIQQPTWPDYSCAEWKPMAADHPDFKRANATPEPEPLDLGALPERPH